MRNLALVILGMIRYVNKLNEEGLQLARETRAIFVQVFPLYFFKNKVKCQFSFKRFFRQVG